VNWLRSNRRSAWIVGLSIAALLVVYLFAVIGILEKGQQYRSEIDRLQPRVSRLQGLMGYEEQLREAVFQAEGQATSFFYPPDTDQAAIAASLQKNVRQTLVEAGLSVSNSQVLPVREESVFDYIGLKLTVTGDLAGLDAALAALSEYRPLLLVESLDIWPSRPSRRNPDVQAQTVKATIQLLSPRLAL
jgi:general secretion pathway protein M